MMNHALSLIDAHYHQWDLAKLALPWLATVDSKINRTYTYQDLEQAYTPLGVYLLGAVYIEVDSANAQKENALMHEQGKQNPHILAQVLRCTLSSTMYIPNGAVGIREPLHTDQQEKGYCLKEEFISGLKLLAQQGLSFDLCIRPEELSDIYQSLQQVPQELVVVINHFGNVKQLDTTFIRDMENLAKLPNVYCKLSGYPTKDKGFVKEVLTFGKAIFGMDRLLYASNFPVIHLYGQLREHVDQLRTFFEDDARIFMSNAQKVYKISSTVK